MADPVTAMPAQGESARMKALKTLANQLPVANSRVATGMQAARDLQLQNAAAAAPATMSSGAIQQAGAQQAATAGQQQVAQAQNNLEQQTQVGQLGLNQQKAESQNTLGQLQMGQKNEELGNLQRLGSIDEQAKQELYDTQMQFAKDESGRTLFNQRQLLDYAASKAQGDEQFKNYTQQAQQLNARKMQLMETAYNKVTADLDSQFKQAEQGKDQKAMQEIKQRKQDLSRQMTAEKNKAANNTAMWSTGVGIAGAVAGSAAGPAGAMAGYQAGSAVGGIAGSQGA